ncbi:hypothetical protein F4861DRAFT_500966 [Xylaria intraflava]|nr:hypothetical protein F4861DRAFT_500966 [Xylaria intraflava]
MLGWALKKGFQGATGLRDAPEDRGDDTAQLDGPDTPAPVFAARAIKNAIWGQSTATNKDHPAAKPKSNETHRAKTATNTTTTAGATTAAAAAAEKEIAADNRSPNKLNSILLTPGTGTSRRKRVSFGQDVKAGNTEPSPFTSSSTRDGKQRKKTTLQQALENARSSERKAPGSQGEVFEDNHTDEEWEWDDENACCNHDVTVDLNEPHSESGKYWKAEWARYREEAKSDIEQLVKYKVNARSFAAKKDTEASQLAQKLKEEQAKVTEMEKQMADMATRLAAARKHGTGEDNAVLMTDLGKQTSLVAEYRDRVKALEARLKEASIESNPNSSGRHHGNMSPRTEQNIHEVSRELRKARSELRQLDRLRDEVKRLKSNLATSRERVAELETQASAEAASELSRVTKLEKQLREVKEESRQKDTEIRKLRRDYESLKRDAKSRTAEAIQVLQEKNAEIDKFEKEIKELKAANTLNRPRDVDSAIAKHNKINQDLASGIDSAGRPSKYEKARPTKGRARAASIQDITLEMTQRSLLQTENGHAPDKTRQEKVRSGGVLADWTTEIPTLELQVKEKNRHQGTEMLDEETILERMDTLARRRTARSANQRPLQDNGRITSDVLSNRVNESSGTKVRGHQQPTADGVLSTDRNHTNMNREVANTQTTSLAENKSAVHSAVDRPTRRSRTQAKTSRTASSNNEAPVVDPVQDQFSRPRVPPTDRSGSRNTAQSSLPADRHAAALARLQRKRMERRKAAGQDLDKENVKP